MITFDHVSVTYAGAPAPSLHDVTLEIPEGELVLVVGPTGSGKSTLLRTVNGLVPHFSGGTLSGRVTVDGLDTARHRPRDLATVVGLVEQNPSTTFVTDVVEDEVAYGMETMGLDPTAIRRRVEETLDLFGLTPLRGRPLGTLSGGQQQRAAIAALFAAGPRVLILDEPTSALDPVAAEEVLASLHRIVHDLGVTVVLAEHRLERVVHHADRVVLVDGGHTSGLLDPAEAMLHSQIYPPVVGLSRLAGWAPTPLSIRDARRRASALRERLVEASSRSVPELRAVGPATALTVSDLRVVRAGRIVIDELDLSLEAGSVTTLMGRNGAGKSTLLGAIAAQHPVAKGRVRLGASSVDPHAVAPRERVRAVGLVPQQPELLLYAETVAAECVAADADFGAEPGATAALLHRISGGIDPTQHPRDLSEGQRLELALAVILAGSPEVLLLDEPTRGLDYGAKHRLGEILSALAAEGTTILLATHDVELAAEVADRVVILADGEVVTDGPARQVLSASPAFAPQVTKVMLPQTWLTVAEVADAIGRSA
ncbi:energy-coupling factor transport system ATP-binding protein [Humibacillus xanthopallidus]|uniref:Energy-coupling factor transport system ATP-binding protein n=1 Tax=Humibacillus xanthopallidus TaxID=412689 RepID=A0A543PTX4_9MICO|nr:ABC transporter ATP-binding protein [Humibacillus xanthopallidus]TQN47532.1 energy-coupling factor transport system ATP-binding protein [Humibacillus xanthopallidus]